MTDGILTSNDRGMVVHPWGMTESKSTVVENSVFQTSLPGVRIYKRTQRVAKLKSQVRGHEGEQNESILATAP